MLCFCAIAVEVLNLFTLLDLNVRGACGARVRAFAAVAARILRVWQATTPEGRTSEHYHRLSIFLTYALLIMSVLVMAYTVMAYTVMASIVSYGSCSYGLPQLHFADHVRFSWGSGTQVCGCRNRCAHRVLLGQA